MRLPVVYRQAARREIIAAAQEYEKQRRGLGALFLDEVARIELHISESPSLYQHVVDDVHHAVLRQFPFGLFYLEEEQRIVVLGCLDLRRDPDTIVGAITKR